MGNDVGKIDVVENERFKKHWPKIKTLQDFSTTDKIWKYIYIFKLNIPVNKDFIYVPIYSTSVSTAGKGINDDGRN